MGHQEVDCHGRRLTCAFRRRLRVPLSCSMRSLRSQRDPFTVSLFSWTLVTCAARESQRKTVHVPPVRMLGRSHLQLLAMFEAIRFLAETLPSP